MGLTDLSELKLFSTEPHPCSYIDSQDATTIFIDPEVEMDGRLYAQLTELGFRRSGSHVYRPKCRLCRACIPIRVPVQYFEPSKSQKRCIKANSDLRVKISHTGDTDEYYELYRRYIEGRHADGDMYPPSRDQYLSFLSKEWDLTRHIELRDAQETLIAVLVSDVLADGISAIYAFFDPELPKRSLGVFGVLHQIKWAQELDLNYVYLGYWIKQCEKMNYKVNYRPFQLFLNNQWVSFTKD